MNGQKIGKDEPPGRLRRGTVRVHTFYLNAIISWRFIQKTLQAAAS
jgi:hypothetical protein